MRIAIIGAGMWGKVHADSIIEEGRASLAALCVRSEGAAAALAQAYPGVPVVRDWRQVVADPRIDAVVIATPTAGHAEQAIAALDAGKHVLLEKPMALTVAEADAICAAVRRSGRVLVEASCRFSRLQAKYRRLRDLIAAGHLGDIYLVHHVDVRPTTYLEYHPGAAWSTRIAEAGGGAMFDWGPYDLSFHLGVLGDHHRLCDVSVSLHHGLRSNLPPGTDIEQHAIADLRFDGGLRYWYEQGGGAHAAVPSQTRIQGTRGGLQCSYLPWADPVITWHHEDARGVVVAERIEVPRDTPWKQENTLLTAHFIDCCRGLAQPLMPAELARAHVEIVSRIYAAGRAG
jgi:predicted dehydrogenase